VPLTDQTALHIECDEPTRFISWIEEGRSIHLNVRLVPSGFRGRARGGLSLRLAEPVGVDPRWRTPSSARPLMLLGVRAERRVVRRGEPVEFLVDLDASYDNPFDPEQVAVDARVRTPSGRTDDVPGFYWQGFRARYEGGEELLTPEGDGGWRVRYTPRETGRHLVTVRARDAGGRALAEPVAFECRDSDSPGFVHVGDAPDGGPRYLAFEAGETFFAIGHNVTTYRADLPDVFRRMAGAGENYTRFWMWSAALGIEWGRPLGHYRMDEAWRLDRVFELARRHGIYVMLCLDTHQDVMEGWRDNPYNAERGGPCRTVMDFFRSEAARAAYRNRLRYIVARWGHHPNLLCWEFINEVEGFEGASRNRQDVARWHEEMAGVVADLDVFDHPITTSLWTTEGWPELWDLPAMDIVQSHWYANDPHADMALEVAAICAQKLRGDPDRPHLFGEYGVDSSGGTDRSDPGGVHLHNGNWAALMSGAASNPVSWWHEEYIDPLRLYGVYRGLARFVAGEPLAGRCWRPIPAPAVEYVDPRPVEGRDLEFSGLRAGWDRSVPEGLRFALRRDGTVEGRDELPQTLHGRAQPDLTSSLTFELDCRAPTRFSVRVGEVSMGAVLHFHVDGRRVRTADLPAGPDLGRSSRWRGRWGIWQTQYDEWFGVDVPAGRHTVRIENTGKDWLELLALRADGYVTRERPPLRVLGMASEDRLLLWVQNEEHTWFNVRDGVRIRPAAPSRMALEGLADGTWSVQWWDTRRGRVTRTSYLTVREGRVTVDLPEVRCDLALKLIRHGGR